MIAMGLLFFLSLLAFLVFYYSERTLGNTPSGWARLELAVALLVGQSYLPKVASTELGTRLETRYFGMAKSNPRLANSLIFNKTHFCKNHMQRLQRTPRNKSQWCNGNRYANNNTLAL